MTKKDKEEIMGMLEAIQYNGHLRLWILLGMICIVNVIVYLGLQ